VADTDAIAREMLSLLGTGRQTALHPELTVADGYAAGAAFRRLREARGERVVGRKIGFTNRTIWPRYNVSEPMAGYVYDTTRHEAADFADAPFDVTGMPEPRLEPEIMFGLDTAPAADMDDATLLGCVGWVALGYEIVQSPYPGWKLTAADSAAGGGLHGALLVGARQPLGRDPLRWVELLRSFAVDLTCNGKLIERGKGANVLDSPLLVLRHLTAMLDEAGPQPPLAAGEIISTGTLTDAQPIVSGQIWTATPAGIPLPPVTVRF
jgi:2-oxo-3-hexenedioate decarboxylase